MSDESHGVKGDKPRPTDRSKYENNWQKVFGREDSSVDVGHHFTSEPHIAKDILEWHESQPASAEIQYAQWLAMVEFLQNIHDKDYPVQDAAILLQEMGLPR